MSGYRRDVRDILGGGLLMLAGGFAFANAMATLRMGTVANMGPGMFPAALGVILFMLGLAIAVPALFREGRKIDADLRSTAAVVAGMLAFGGTVGVFGLVPAIFLLVLIVSRADSRLTLPRGLLLAAGLSAMAAALFRLGLGLRLPLLVWPW